MALAIINPNNEKATKFPISNTKSTVSYYYDPSEGGKPEQMTAHIALKVPECLRYLSLCYLLIGLIASILFFDPRESDTPQEK